MKRSGTKVMLRLIGLVKPLTGWMILAILMGLAGHLCASGSRFWEDMQCWSCYRFVWE